MAIQNGGQKKFNSVLKSQKWEKITTSNNELVQHTYSITLGLIRSKWTFNWMEAKFQFYFILIMVFFFGLLFKSGADKAYARKTLTLFKL